MDPLTINCCQLTEFAHSYFVNNPEALHFLLFLFSDRSTPADFQHADIFSVNTYRAYLSRNTQKTLLRFRNILIRSVRVYKGGETAS